MPGDKRREQILRSAVDLFSKRGFSGTTTKDIARLSGVSEAMVFKHFSSKDELYGAILDAKKCSDALHQFPWEGNQTLLKAMEEKDDFAVFYNLGVHTLTKQQADIAFMRLLFYSALEEHELAERFFGEFVLEVYKFLGGYVERRQADGAFKRMDPRLVVRSFLGMLIHHSLNNILWDKRRRILDISNEDAAKHFAEMILSGVSAERTAAK